MKAAGKSKDDVKPHVTALLDLKKQLADFKAVNSSPPTAPLPNGVAESALADLEAQIAVQVRL